MKALRTTVLMVLIAIVSVVSLAAYTGLFKPNPKNGFARSFLAKLKANYAIERPKDLTSFIGYNKGRIYFSSKKVNVIYSFTLLLDNDKKEILNIPVNQKWQNYFKHFIVKDKLFSWAPQVPAMYSISNESSSPLVKIDLPYTFTGGAMISPFTYLIRSFDPANSRSEQTFIKYNSQTHELTKNTEVTEHLKDRGMLTDGMLHYDKETHSALYVHFFSNQLIWIDTNLNVTHRGHTIDTFKTVKGSMGIFKKGSKKKATLNSPPEIVNLYSRVDHGLLFNYSAKRADNEEQEGYSKDCKLDIYEIKDGKYLGSLVIPFFKTEEMESFGIVDGNIIAIYKNYLAIYPFDIKSLNK